MMPPQPPKPTTWVNGPVPLTSNASLWRYVSLPVLLLYLKGRLRLSSIRELRRIDPNEGDQKCDCVTQTEAFSSAEYVELREHIKSQMSPQDLKLFEINQQYPKADQEVVFGRWHKIVIASRYALCFFESTHESIAMWREFAPSGVAIRTSLNSLEVALKETHRPWRISKMLYRDKSQEITPDDTQNEPVLKEILRYPHLVKSREYEYEKEIRLCTVDPAQSPHLILQCVPPESWIQEIRISPKIWHKDAQILINLIADSCPSLKSVINFSSIMPTPGIADLFEEQINADVSKILADGWPAFLHKP